MTFAAELLDLLDAPPASRVLPDYTAFRDLARYPEDRRVWFRRLHALFELAAAVSRAVDADCSLIDPLRERLIVEVLCPEMIPHRWAAFESADFRTCVIDLVSALEGTSPDPVRVRRQLRRYASLLSYNGFARLDHACFSFIVAARLCAHNLASPERREIEAAEERLRQALHEAAAAEIEAGIEEVLEELGSRAYDHERATA